MIDPDTKAAELAPVAWMRVAPDGRKVPSALNRLDPWQEHENWWTEPLYGPEASALIASQRAEIEELTAALRPFAEYMAGGLDLDNTGAPVPDELGVGWVYLTHADFRRAARALGSQP